MLQQCEAYLNSEPEDVEHYQCHWETPGCAMNGKSIELSQDHYVHEQPAYNHVDVFRGMVLSEEVVDSLSPVKDLVFYAGNVLSHQE